MESLKDILSGKKLAKPDEIGVIKEYVRQKYKSNCSIKLQRGAIILNVPNAALAATIQLERQELIAACNLGDKRLVIRNSR
ncbi:MAG TPA: hypothetical protein VI336_03635 [Candidatus Saccharimonadales bacterium]|nr:hypothetical protein [Candidatus Saccharimonadales bacterium]